MSEAQVLGITSPPPVAGSPILTFEMLTIYFVVFFLLLIVIYTIFHFIQKPLLLAHKLKLVFIISLFLKIALIGSILLLASFWLLPTPKVNKTTPINKAVSVGSSEKIVIVFDRPVDRSTMQKIISPETVGIWTFEDPIYSTHLYSKVVFHPTVAFRPDTKYTVTINKISNLLKVTNNSNFAFSFTTQPSPKVASINPHDGSEKVDINASLKVNLTSRNENLSLFDFSISPQASISVSLDSQKTSYKITPDQPLQQGVKYKLSVKKTNVIYHIPANTILERDNTITEKEIFFTTKEAPGIERFTPYGGEILPNEKIKITFSDQMDRNSVENSFVTAPPTSGSYEWTDDRNVTYNPAKLEYETSYKMKIPKNTKDKSGGFITGDIEKEFTTIGRVRVETIYPTDGWKAIGIKNQIKITFDQSVEAQSAIEKFELTPSAEGEFYWSRNTLIFTPKKMSYSTKYQVKINSGIKSINGLDSTHSFTSIFTTQDETYKLAVPSYLQKYSLSCELSALKMALEYKGVNISEDEILEKLGTDNTPKKGNIWGNPHNAFVGNVNGRQMVTGYGVYWEPIARVARSFRNALDFRGWTISQMTKMISENNPVILWVYSSNGAPATWSTMDGRAIEAVRGEHAVVAVGFVGEIDNPTSIIVNDPLLGQVQWPRTYFDQKWKPLGHSGVVIY